MTPASQQLLSSALTLPEAERLELASALFEASEPPSPSLVGDAWLSELNRRSASVETGEANLVPWPTVKLRVRARRFVG